MFFWDVGVAINQELPEAIPNDSGMPVITYNVIGLPAGLSFDAALRIISGTPDIGTDGKGTITYTAEATDYVTGSLEYVYYITPTGMLPAAAYVAGAITHTAGELRAGEIITLEYTPGADVGDRKVYNWFPAEPDNIIEATDTILRYRIPETASGDHIIHMYVVIYGEGILVARGTEEGDVSLTLSISLAFPRITGLNNDYTIRPNVFGLGFGRIDAPTLDEESYYDVLEYWWKGTDYITLAKESSDTVDDDGFVNTGETFIRYGYNERTVNRDNRIQLKLLAKGDGTLTVANAIYTGLTTFYANEEVTNNQPALEFSGSLTNDGSGG